MRTAELSEPFVRSDGMEFIHPFPGMLVLQERILAAHAAGDEELLRDLQRRFREGKARAAAARCAARERARLAQKMRPIREVIDRVQASRSPFDSHRTVLGYAMSWSADTATDKNGRGFRCTIDRESLKGWMRETIAQSVPVRVNHTAADVGRLVDFWSDTRGLIVEGLIDDDAASAILPALEDGTIRFFSIGFGDLSGEVAIGEVSLLTGAPADERAEVLLVGGHVPAWKRRARSAELLRSLGVRRVRTAHP
jgi:phage head maturation protease